MCLTVLHGAVVLSVLFVHEALKYDYISREACRKWASLLRRAVDGIFAKVLCVKT